MRMRLIAWCQSIYMEVSTTKGTPPTTYRTGTETWSMLSSLHLSLDGSSLSRHDSPLPESLVRHRIAMLYTYGLHGFMIYELRPDR